MLCSFYLGRLISGERLIVVVMFATTSCSTEIIGARMGRSRVMGT